MESSISRQNSWNSEFRITRKKNFSNIFAVLQKTKKDSFKNDKERIISKCTFAQLKLFDSKVLYIRVLK